ncbi:MAG: cyclic nucleotide-gated ion channel [Hyphomicrobiaceae bacterium]
MSDRLRDEDAGIGAVRDASLSHRLQRWRGDWRSGAEARADLRRRVYDVLEVGRGESRLSTWVENGLIVLIFINVFAFVLETVPSIHIKYRGLLSFIEWASVLMFTFEYALRIWSCVEVPFLRRLSPMRARIQYAKSPYLLIDLLAIVPFYLSFLVPIDLRVLRVLRLFRFLKLARYSPAMNTLMRVLANERRTLTGALLLVMTLLLFAATIMYYLESEAQPDRFGSIPEAAWWAIVTLTTVGYGDAVPVTDLGRFVGGLVMLSGLIVLALPIAIIATGFAQEVGRRDFVLTWSMMSRIPLFADLDAQAITEVMRYLHAHNYPARWEVIGPGSPGDAMYFVASGRIRRQIAEDEQLLGAGEFFGEVALLDHAVNEHTYVTTTRSRLLKLDRDGYQRLHAAHPDIAEEIRKVADTRRGGPSPAHEDGPEVPVAITGAGPVPDDEDEA